MPKVAEYLRKAGEDVIEFHENITTNKTDNLNTIVKYHNSQSRDLDVSVNFNSVDTPITDNPYGVECYIALKLCSRPKSQRLLRMHLV